MNLEKLIENMMTITIEARLWHWTTDNAQHHTTYEQFLTQNEQFTDSFVESALGNEKQITFSEVKVNASTADEYKILDTKKKIKDYRSLIKNSKTELEKKEESGNEELVNVLDDVTELCSKTLYLLSLK